MQDHLKELLLQQISHAVPIQCLTANQPPGASPHTHEGWEIKIFAKYTEFVPPFLIHNSCKENLLVSILICNTQLIISQAKRLPLKLPLDSALHILLVKILEVYLQLPANEVSCRRQLTATFFKLIYEQYQSLEFPGIELKPAQMILEYLERHYYKQDLSIAQLAEDLGYSQQYLNRQLRLHQGCSIRQQLIKIRLRHALELLRSERFLITDAARLTGWQSSFYFSNVFKQYYGVRPCNWKKITD